MAEIPQTTPQPRHRIEMALAVLLTIAIIVAVFWKVRSPDANQSQDTGDNQSDPHFYGSGIDDGGDNNWRAYAGTLMAYISGNPANSFVFRVPIFRILDDNTRSLNAMRRSLVQDPSIDEMIDLTPDQLDALRTIDPPAVVMSDADKQKLQQLWHAWEKADDEHKPNAQQAFLDALGDVSKNSLGPTKKAWIDAADSVRQILTIEQQVKLAVYLQNGTTSPPPAPLMPTPTQ